MKTVLPGPAVEKLLSPYSSFVCGNSSIELYSTRTTKLLYPPLSLVPYILIVEAFCRNIILVYSGVPQISRAGVLSRLIFVSIVVVSK